jgi:hypothetical protein
VKTEVKMNLNLEIKELIYKQESEIIYQSKKLQKTNICTTIYNCDMNQRKGALQAWHMHNKKETNWRNQSSYINHKNYLQT